jgi:precorrin-6B methylase 2
VSKLYKHIHGITLYRKFRYRKGYGVHSPFIYSFITKVVEEKHSFYVFDEIEKFRKKMIADNGLLSDLTLKETQHRNYGALLFRIVNFFRCSCVIQFGGSTGIMSLYLTAALHGHGCCYVFEKRKGVSCMVKNFLKDHSKNNLQIIETEYANAQDILSYGAVSADLIFINKRSLEFSEAEKIFSSCLSLAGKKTILIIDHINVDKEMKDLWQKIKNHPKSQATLDLYALGIVFFDNNLPKKHYITYFNYGKKQNIHKNRRRRFNFISWRKKSFKNKHSH